MWGSLAFVYLLFARLAYVVWVGATLKQQDRDQRYTRRYGVEGAYARFRRLSNVLMVNDTAAFILLNIVTIDTLHLPGPRAAQIAFGLAIGIFGIAIKAWATATLGTQSYHWHNFFVPTVPERPNPPGPYRFLKNPMYSVGYLQTYGLACVCASMYGMIASAFMQATIMVFNATVEKPHYLSLLRDAQTRPAGVRGAPGLEQSAAPRFS
jgi:isoprenylcysteine carboxyl methyltransferase (ICMT) family protein YpbQ